MTRQLKGVIALPPTPLTIDRNIDKESLRSEIDFLMKNGCCGAGVLAGIGEGYLMSNKDWLTVTKTAVDHLKDRGPLLVGIAAMGTSQAVELAKSAENLGADAVLAFNPQGMGPYTSDGLYEHFRALTDAVDIQVVPYARDNDPIPFEALGRLVEEERISYMKYAFRDCETLRKITQSFGDRLFTFCGADSWTLRYILLGCRGIMTATAAVLPKENVELLSLVENGQIWEARKLWFQKILPWNDSGFYENWQTAHKLALKHMGVIESAMHPTPQTPMKDYQIEEIQATLKYLGKA